MQSLTVMATNIRTVRELREYLASLEVRWSEMDTKMMGKFEDQAIGAWTDGGGYAPANATIDEIGTIIIATEYHYNSTLEKG